MKNNTQNTTSFRFSKPIGFVIMTTDFLKEQEFQILLVTGAANGFCGGQPSEGQSP